MKPVSAVLAIALTLLSAPASTQNFYKDSQIRIIVGATTGNDYDLWARLIARHMGRHIPGHPTFVVETMPGAGSVVAANYLYSVAPKDGSVIGLISRSMPAAAVMKLPNIRFDPARFNWLGSPEVNNLVFFVNNSAGIEKVADLFDRELIVGGTNAAQGLTVGPLLLKNLLGMKLKVITGYPGPNEMALAAARGELQGFANTIGGPAGARRPWVESGQMRVLFNFEPEPVRGLGVPTVMEHAKTEEHRQVLTFFAGNVLLGRPVLAPPDVPAERVAVLRQALAAVFRDPALLKEAEASQLEVAPISAERLSQLVSEIADTPAHIIKRAEQASQSK